VRRMVKSAFWGAVSTKPTDAIAEAEQFERDAEISLDHEDFKGAALFAAKAAVLYAQAARSYASRAIAASGLGVVLAVVAIALELL
jgi:hypothetical protein